MENSLLDFLGTALIPELGSYVSACSSGYVHLVLICIAALRALPYQLAVFFYDFYFTVEAALLAIVALGIEFCIHDVVVDELDYFHNSIQVVLHVRHFNIAYRAAC